ncbi:MAG: DUF3021 family protein [Bacillota bacterium]|nr:DUF3021 family protein [Bacillota bacterium]
MKIPEFIRKIIKDYFMILGVVIFVVTVINSGSIFVLTIKDLHTIMIGVLAGDLTSLIYYFPNEMSEKDERVRICIHFILLEVVLLLLAHILNVARGYTQLMLLGAEIALINLILSFLRWLADKKDANKINEKLKSMKKMTSNLDK